MNYLRIRNIEIDVIPDSEPFIRLTIEKVITNSSNEITQIIGNYDRIYRRISDIHNQPCGNVSDDGVVDGMELYKMVAVVGYTWIIEKHGGQFINGKVVI